MNSRFGINILYTGDNKLIVLLFRTNFNIK